MSRTCNAAKKALKPLCARVSPPLSRPFFIYFLPSFYRFMCVCAFRTTFFKNVISPLTFFSETKTLFVVLFTYLRQLQSVICFVSGWKFFRPRVGDVPLLSIASFFYLRRKGEEEEPADIIFEWKHEVKKVAKEGEVGEGGNVVYRPKRHKWKLGRHVASSYTQWYNSVCARLIQEREEWAGFLS